MRNFNPSIEFARDPAGAPDGRIYIVVMHGNKLARFDLAHIDAKTAKAIKSSRRRLDRAATRSCAKYAL